MITAKEAKTMAQKCNEEFLAKTLENEDKTIQQKAGGGQFSHEFECSQEFFRSIKDYYQKLGYYAAFGGPDEDGTYKIKVSWN